MTRKKEMKSLEKEESPWLGGDGASSKSQSDYTTDDVAVEGDFVKTSGESALDIPLVANNEEAFEQLRQIAAAMDAQNYVQNLEWNSYTKDGRCKAFWCIFYPESCNPHMLQWLEERGIKGVILEHDRDFWPNGNPKKHHGHGLFYDEGKFTQGKANLICNGIGAVMPQPVLNIYGACQYLLHMNIDPQNIPEDVGKVKYRRDEAIVINGFDFDHYLTFSESDIQKACMQLIEIAREENFVNWADFHDYVNEYHLDLAVMLYKHQVERPVRQYVQANYWRNRNATELHRLTVTNSEMMTQIEKDRRDFETMTMKQDELSKQIVQAITLLQTVMNSAQVVITDKD